MCMCAHFCLSTLCSDIILQKRKKCGEMKTAKLKGLHIHEKREKRKGLGMKSNKYSEKKKKARGLFREAKLKLTKRTNGVL